MKDGCFAMCLNYIMDVPVPNFVEIDIERWYQLAQEWLAEKGMKIVWISSEVWLLVDPQKDTPYIYCGITKSGECHATVWANGKEVFNPDNHELIQLTEIYALRGH